MLPKFTPLVYSHAIAVVPHASNNHLDGEAMAIYVGGAGTVALVLPDDSVVSFTAVAGGIIPVRSKRVNATGTTATLMIALYAIKNDSK